MLCGAICILTDVSPADALSGRNNEHLCVMLEMLPFDASRTLEEEDLTNTKILWSSKRTKTSPIARG